MLCYNGPHHEKHNRKIDFSINNKWKIDYAGKRYTNVKLGSEIYEKFQNLSEEISKNYEGTLPEMDKFKVVRSNCVIDKTFTQITDENNYARIIDNSKDYNDVSISTEHPEKLTQGTDKDNCMRITQRAHTYYIPKGCNKKLTQKTDRDNCMYIIDCTTQERYLNESKITISGKCFLLTIATPVVHTIALLINVVSQIAKLILSMLPWMQDVYSFNKSLKDLGRILLKIITFPIFLTFLELAAIYGIFNPYDGRKLYAGLERYWYGGAMLAPCFQPDPKWHLLGGDINEKDAF